MNETVTDKTIVDWINTYWLNGEGGYDEYYGREPENVTSLSVDLDKYRLHYGHLPPTETDLVWFVFSRDYNYFKED